MLASTLLLAFAAICMGAGCLVQAIRACWSPMTYQEWRHQKASFGLDIERMRRPSERGAAAFAHTTVHLGAALIYATACYAILRLAGML